MYELNTQTVRDKSSSQSPISNRHETGGKHIRVSRVSPRNRYRLWVVATTRVNIFTVSVPRNTKSNWWEKPRTSDWMSRDFHTRGGRLIIITERIHRLQTRLLRWPVRWSKQDSRRNTLIGACMLCRGIWFAFRLTEVRRLTLTILRSVYSRWCFGSEKIQGNLRSVHSRARCIYEYQQWKEVYWEVGKGRITR